MINTQNQNRSTTLKSSAFANPTISKMVKGPMGNTNLPQKEKKKSPFKYLLGGVALLLLIVGSASALFLTQSNQDIRQQAASPGDCWCQDGGQVCMNAGGGTDWMGHGVGGCGDNNNDDKPPKQDSPDGCYCDDRLQQSAIRPDRFFGHSRCRHCLCLTGGNCEYCRFYIH